MQTMKSRLAVILGRVAEVRELEVSRENSPCWTFLRPRFSELQRLIEAVSAYPRTRARVVSMSRNRYCVHAEGWPSGFKDFLEYLDDTSRDWRYASLSDDEDYVDPGVHDVWLVVETTFSTIRSRQTPGTPLHFGPTSKEIDEIEELAKGLSGKPILARLNDPHADALITASEIPQLAIEIQYLRSSNSISNSLANKLERLCKIATNSHSGLFFAAQ